MYWLTCKRSGGIFQLCNVMMQKYIENACIIKNKSTFFPDRIYEHSPISLPERKCVYRSRWRSGWLPLNENLAKTWLILAIASFTLTGLTRTTMTNASYSGANILLRLNQQQNNCHHYLIMYSLLRNSQISLQ